MTAPSDPQARAEAKRLATATARAALAGVTLHATTDDTDRRVYVVSRWALTRTLDGLDAVEQWLDQVTGQKPR